MSLKSEPYYWVECDGCGVRCDYGDFSAMSDEGSAEDYARDDEWTMDGAGKHHCPRCPTLCTEDHAPQGSGVDGEEWECDECAFIVAYDAARNEWVPA